MYDGAEMISPPAISDDILNAALTGLEAQKRMIEEHILEVKQLLGTAPKRRGRPPKNALAPQTLGPAPAPRKRRKFSAETRRKMAEAQRKRWAAAKRATA